MTGGRAPRVAVVGAGLGGLTLARVLHVRGVPVTVYERDAGPDARPQGGMLDLHEDGGQAALREAGLYEAFRALVMPGGDAMRVLDRHGRVHLEDGGGGDRPEVSRRALRALLLESLPAGAVRWGARLEGVRALGGGRHALALAGGEAVEADVLVGADGGWSRVRPLVSGARPAHAGVWFVEAHLADADRRHPAAAARVGRGSLFALGDERGFLAHRDPDGALHAYAALRAPADWPLARAEPDARRSALLAHFDGWEPGLRSLIADADGALAPRPIYALPVGHRWPRVPGVTLVGDAAHLMSPFAGEGANLALRDGAELARALAEHDDVEAALAASEAARFPRSEAAAAESAANLELCFRADAPRGLVARFAEYGAAAAFGDAVGDAA